MAQTNGPPNYLEKSSSIRIFATYGEKSVPYPFMLGETTFQLQHYINKRAEKITLPFEHMNGTDVNKG